MPTFKLPARDFDFLVQTFETGLRYRYVNEQEVCYDGVKIVFNKNDEYAAIVLDSGTTIEREE
jgi:hypothetical protein